MRRIASFLLAILAGCSNGPVDLFAPATDVEHVEQSAPAKLELAGRVTDAADLLGPAQEASLAQRLELLEQTTGHQMVIVTVPSLGGEDIADFARDLGNAWGIGRAREDDGVILLVAPNERQVRIAVGYGLEATLTDALCSQIIQDEIVPFFRRGDLVGGIGSGTDALIKRLS